MGLVYTWVVFSEFMKDIGENEVEQKWASLESNSKSDPQCVAAGPQLTFCPAGVTKAQARDKAVTNYETKLKQTKLLYY